LISLLLKFFMQKTDNTTKINASLIARLLPKIQGKNAKGNEKIRK